MKIRKKSFLITLCAILSFFLAVYSGDYDTELSKSNLFTIKAHASSYFDGYQCVIFNEKEVSIADASCASGDVIIPPVLGGYSVTGIGPSAFSDTDITSVVIPQGVTEISFYAFKNCDKLTNVIIPNSVKGIALYAFNGCSNLTDIYYIGTEEEWSLIYVDEGPQDYEPFLNATIHFNYIPGEESLIKGMCGDDSTWAFNVIDYKLTISGTGKTDNWANPTYTPWHKYKDFISNVFVNDGITGVGPYAFYDHINLKNAVFSDSVLYIGQQIFAGCSNLSGVILGDGITGIAYGAFANSGIEQIKIPKNVKSISDCAFSHCTNLKSVIMDGVTSIGDDSFSYCSSLKNFIIPDSVICIGQTAFRNCENLISVSIGNGVKTMGGAEFLDCISLKNVIIGSDTSADINCDEFIGCSALESVSVDINNTIYSSDEHGVLFNKDKTRLIWYPTGNLSKSYTIPDSVTDINYGAFENCTNISSIMIPYNVTNIDDRAFRGCDNITDVYFEGTAEKWNTITIRKYNESLTNAKIHFLLNRIIWNIDDIKIVVFVKPGDAIVKPEEPQKVGYEFIGWSSEIPDVMPAEDLTFTAKFEKIPEVPKTIATIPAPSTTTINYGDSIWLHANIEGDLPAGARIIWTPSNNNFEIVEVSADGLSCKITPKSSGTITFTVSVVDADEKVLSTDTQDMTAKAEFFQKIIAFFKKLFGLNKTIPNVLKL